MKALYPKFEFHRTNDLGYTVLHLRISSESKELCAVLALCCLMVCTNFVQNTLNFVLASLQTWSDMDWWNLAVTTSRFAPGVWSCQMNSIVHVFLEDMNNGFQSVILINDDRVEQFLA